MGKGQTTDKVSLQKLEDRARMMRQFEVDDLKAVLSTESGRAFYYRIVFELAGLETPSWSPHIKEGLSASLHHAYLEGMRAVGRIMLLEAQSKFPAHWRDMLNERLAKEEADNLARENIQQSAGESNHE